MSSSVLDSAPAISLRELDVVSKIRRPAAAPSVARPAPSWWEALLWTLAYVAMPVIPVMVLGVWLLASGRWDGLGEMPREQLMVAALASQILGVCLTVFALRVRVGRNWTRAIGLRRPPLVPCLLAALCVPALLLVGVGVETGMTQLTGVQEPAGELVAEGMAHYGLWLCLLVVPVGAAVEEELFCRGFLGHGLVGRYGVLVGILFTSVIFGAIHMNITQGVWAFVMGCCLHLAYLATRALWVPMLMHFLNNLVATLSMALWPDFDPSWSQVLMIAVPALAVAIAAAWALYRLRERQPVALAV